MRKIILAAVVCHSLTAGVAGAQSPYISKVFDFQPAPGQFVNELPEYEEGDTREDIIRKVEEGLVNNGQVMVSLGGYGGYIVFGFDHLVQNIPGKYDFKILGNAFWAAANPNPDALREGGSCEPGIVMVSYDANGNGLPDDTWYELAGSEYKKPETVKKYELTYYKPDKHKAPTPDPDYAYLNDTSYIKWKSNLGDSGYVARNVFHAQSYYPLWITDDSITFKGTKLADNYVDESGTGTYYVQYAYGWGYVDNRPNNDPLGAFAIEWAVDNEGHSVQLPGINFVKVYTGVNQYCGWLGETSTEVMGAEDLHLTGNDTDIPGLSGLRQPGNAAGELVLLTNPVKDRLIITSTRQQTGKVYDFSGRCVMILKLENGTNHIDCFLQQGVYTIVTADQSIKFIK